MIIAPSFVIKICLISDSSPPWPESGGFLKWKVGSNFFSYFFACVGGRENDGAQRASRMEPGGPYHPTKKV